LKSEKKKFPRFFFKKRKKKFKDHLILLLLGPKKTGLLKFLKKMLY